jgi:capsular exopolysaccharide synthesis family protein
LDLRDYLRIIRRNWILITAVTLAGILVGGAASVLTKPTYTAETQLFVAIQSSGSVQELQQGNTFSQARVQSYVKTVESPAVLQPVIDSLGLTVSVGELSSRVHASADLNTVLINISVADSSAVQSAAIAQAVATSLVETVENLEKPKSGGSSPVSLSVISPAVAPTVPSAPNTRLNLILGLLVGLTLGAAAAVLRSSLDSLIRGEGDVGRVTTVPVLGGIAFDAGSTKKPLLTQTSAQSQRAESFRQLRTNIKFADVSKTAKTILVTSSLPGEGKSTTATNLAIALAHAGQSVCLVDADLRRPAVHSYLGLERNAGLTTALIGAADLNDLLQPWGEDNLFVLTSGEIPPNPSELLGSEEMGHVLKRLEAAFDAVIVDAPPLLPVTDAAVLSQYVGGVLLIVGCGSAHSQELGKAIDSLALVEANVLGIVMNRLATKGPDAYRYASYTYGVEPQAEGASTRRRASETRSNQLPIRTKSISELDDVVFADDQTARKRR